MNGLFGNFSMMNPQGGQGQLSGFGRGSGGYMMSNVQAPQQNVASYLRMPVMNVPQQKQYPSIGDIVQMAYPQQEDTFTNNPAIRHIAGLPPIEPQANQQISQSERALLHIAGLSPNQK